MSKLWGGRFSKATDTLVDDFNSSIRFDARMYAQDIEGSMAHAEMLGRQGIIPEADAALIVKTLGEIKTDIENGKVEFEIDAEDIHMNIETILISRIGDVGKRLHTGRSRNDQVALDVRMYLRHEVDELLPLLEELKASILTIAEANLDTIMPGYTHLQKAQPITLAHHLMAYYEMLRRDCDRLHDCRRRINVMPLGSGALAGTTYPLDREFVAKKLGFDSVTVNSLDGVSDRDFVCELAFDLSVIMMHLSRLSEEIILWSSHEFSFIELDDAYSTRSSIMPQKKNRMLLSLSAEKTGRVYGSLYGSSHYDERGFRWHIIRICRRIRNRFSTQSTQLKCAFPYFLKMLLTMRIKRDNMLRGAKGGFTNATDVADYLVKHGLPFRDAHAVVGKMVAYCIENGKVIDDLSMEEFKKFSDLIEDDIYNEISLETCVNQRKLIGGPAYDTVKHIIDSYKLK